MTIPPPPITEPDPSALTCPGHKVGPCAVCRRKTHRYGLGDSPLCGWCMTGARHNWGPGVHYNSVRPDPGPGAQLPVPSTPPGAGGN
ncbi:hypothetical protein GCM10010280_16400 [Streptomyces pilosus]|uniref:Uncharacterized protein n=1 Tax=Streptomyces pilosus TaxID=28893 RepID=A0A918BJA6_9ACTN|nr:hypothetical protein GCM10010280_16400 [Streptomyces pilosus]